MPGRKIDNSDSQYASFRDNVPYLFIVMALHPALRKIYERVYPISRMASHGTYKMMPNGSKSPSDPEYLRADDRLDQRITFDVMFNLLFLIALHGYSAPKVLILIYINFTLATKLNREYVTFTTWLFNIGILFANELGQGYPYSTIVKIFKPSNSPGDEHNANWASYLDSHGGLMPRWEILFNVTVLRLISFNIDYVWAKNRSGSSSPMEVRQLSQRDLQSSLRLVITRRSSSILQT